MILLAVMLLVYFGVVCMINFLAPPSYYDSDMYTDIRYAVEVWNHKSVFPEGWVFGNQLYFMSTPVLAGIFYGITGNATLSMGIASTIMAFLVLLAFDWMMKPAVPAVEARLSGLVMFMGLMLFFGDAWHETSGWQLLFTMCSYYACYAMTVFLVFGCWLRSRQLGQKRYNVLFAAACILSFGTGIQSLRQMAIMVLPLIGGEFVRILFRKWRKEPFEWKSIFVTGCVSCLNLLGLVTSRILDLEQVEIIGQMDLVMPSDWFRCAKQGVLLALSLVMNHDAVSFGMLAVLMVACGIALVGLVIRAGRHHETAGQMLLVVLVLSVLAILAVDTLTSMLVRSIYYFMLFPLMAFLISWLYGTAGKKQRVVLFVLIFAMFLLSGSRNLSGVFVDIRDRKSESAYEISDFLQENGYTTLYAAWNQGADVAVASDGEITAGFWEYQEDPFFFYKYLCNPDIFRADSNHCVYLFYGEQNASLGVEKAKTKNIQMTQIHYFPESDIYLYTAPENIMEAFW